MLIKPSTAIVIVKRLKINICSKSIKKIQTKLDIKFKTRGISIAISLIIFLLAITFVALELVPELIVNLENLIKSIPVIFSTIEDYVLNLASDYPDIQSQISEVFNNTANWNSIIVSILNYIINGSISFVTSFVNSIITIFTSLVFAIYMLCQKEYLITGCKKVMKAYLNEDKTNKLLEIGRLSNHTFSKFVSGQCVEAVILGTILIEPVLSVIINVIKEINLNSFNVNNLNMNGFNIVYLILLIFGSMMLTIISGIIPSIMASRKDPVKALLHQ